MSDDDGSAGASSAASPAGRNADDLARARRICALAYVVALVAAAVTVAFAPIDHPFWKAAAADVAGTLVIFGFSVAYDNSSFYDAYWSVAPIVIGLWWWGVPEARGADPTRQILVLALITWWGLRLTYNWLRHWKGLHHEDWRYAGFRRTTGKGYWIVSFLGFHFFPTVQVFAAMAAAYAAMVVGTRPLNWVDGVATLVTAGAVLVEAVADRQLHEFARHNDDPDRVLDTGLWAYSRHPNYFGEIAFWWGLCIFAFAAAPEAWWASIGAIAITVMFRLISVPLIETRMLEKRPHYRAHQTRISMIIPWFPRRS
ncbi:MAG: DUF1295 domain-containing protein [Myxococcota bacterium]